MDEFGQGMFGHSGETKGIRREPYVPPAAPANQPNGAELTTMSPDSHAVDPPDTITPNKDGTNFNMPTQKHHTEKYYEFQGQTYTYQQLRDKVNSRKKTNGINMNYVIMAVVAGFVIISMK